MTAAGQVFWLTPAGEPPRHVALRQGFRPAVRPGIRLSQNWMILTVACQITWTVRSRTGLQRQRKRIGGTDDCEYSNMLDATEIQADAPRGAAHSQDSSLREQALGHRFLAELLSLMWRDGRRDIEVLKREVDRAGYDIVLEANGIIRHVQLKSSFIGSKVRDVSVNTKLLAKPGGCVTWLEFDPDTLAIRKYLWFGGSPGSALPGLGSKI